MLTFVSRLPGGPVVADDDYIEVDAVIRMRKGERLANSKKTEGWSRGFTPKSTDRGPEHVEIRIKDSDESSDESETLPEPEIIYVQEYVEQPRQRTQEEEELDELLGLLVLLGLIKAAEWAQPRLKTFWNERVIPYWTLKRATWLERKKRRKLDNDTNAKVHPAVVLHEPASDLGEVDTALEAYEANMTSAEARQHLAEALIAQHFANEKMRLLASAKIADGTQPPELTSAVRNLTPGQVSQALEAMLASQPALIGDLEQLLAGRQEEPLQLGSPKLDEALRITNPHGQAPDSCHWGRLVRRS